ncbi:G-protein alpha subunit-domain-containing protein [Xylaria digitata]|nr:G-protein alpha subunit-domain-containing protein [Xylaria digitata]
MDPATIFQIVGTVVSLGDTVIKCITRLSALKAQFHDAPIIVTSMIGQLHMVKIAQDQLSPLISPNFAHDARYRQLASQIGNALDSFGPILLVLGQQLDRYEGIGADRMKARSRLGFLHGEREMTNLSILLDRQVNALNLLLSAIQCQTWTQQSEIITQKESQSILRLAQDCSSSLVGLEDVASFISENTAAISTQFEFDDVLRSTLLYQTAERSHLRQAIRAKKTKHLDNTSTNSSVQRPSASGLKWAFQAMRLSKPIALSDILRSQQGIRVDVRREAIVETMGDNVVPEEDPFQESSQSNSGDTDGTGSGIETGQPAQPLLNGTESGSPGSPGSPRSPRPQSSFSNWRKAFQRRASNARDTQSHQHHHEVEDYQPKVAKVLLLGAAGGGKSTLLKALGLRTEAEDAEYNESYLRTLVWHNALESARNLLRAIEECADVPVMASARTLLLDPCPDCDRDPALNPQHASEVASTILSLRPSIETQNVMRWKIDYRFHDNVRYHIENINRFAEQAAHCSAPTHGDLLRTQVTTTGIHPTMLTYQGSQYCVYDVGGERSERKKWLCAFPDVSVVLFPVDTISFNRRLREDETVDRMLEQFTLFESISNSGWFKRTNFVVVFTKIDLVEEYLEEVDVDAFLRIAHVISDTEPRITGVDEYLRCLEAHFRRLVKQTDAQERFRFIHANLVDVDKHNPAVDVFDALRSFNQPERLNTPGEELSEKEPAGRETDGISYTSAETFEYGYQPPLVRESEDVNPLLIGMAQ